MGIAIRISGIDTLQRRLGALGKAVDRPALQTAMVAGAKIIEADAKRRAPVETGTLRRSITTVTTGDGVAVGSNLVYARRIELGFSGTDSLGRAFDQPPQPYLRPAFDANRDRMIEAIGAAVAVMIAKAVSA